MELGFPNPQHAAFGLAVGKDEAQQLATAHPGRVQEYDGHPIYRRSQRRSRRGGHIVRHRQHSGYLLGLYDDGPAERLAPGEVQGIGHEAARLFALTMRAEPADNALAVEESVARQMRERRAPLIKARPIELLSRSPAA